MRDKAEAFRSLHQRCFVIANAWDAGSARILAGLGFQALATSSGAHAGTLGRRDGQVTREEALAHARAIVEATDLPVSADLENCFADEPRAPPKQSGSPPRSGWLAVRSKTRREIRSTTSSLPWSASPPRPGTARWC
ncbi:MAG TPA: isocitrate lyase/phosphoenolpyruvate mutase family protein [Burkholderiales bacterium]|nr:isocitrate lyase/phosphoenolpyruvate mutase family protein [Burkholderiales bacterium]